MKKGRIKKALLAVGLVGVIAALLQVPPAWLGIPEFRGLIGWPPQPSNPPQTQPPAAPEGSGPKPEKKAESQPAVAAQQSIDGSWGSNTSGNIYHLISKDSENFDIYIDDPVQGKTYVGTGTRHQRKVVASLIVLSKNRTASLNLTLSEDGQTMEGTFTGADLREKGYLIFRRLNSGFKT
ncbi:MAG TPA: hypothetical protein VF131_24685 [Blastocatellia bacterium]|nr:hypothetical protein [Blastocatellia bacterium]